MSTSSSFDNVGTPAVAATPAAARKVVKYTVQPHDTMQSILVALGGDVVIKALAAPAGMAPSVGITFGPGCVLTVSVPS